MNTATSVISSGFWLPEPAVEAGWKKPKTKPVQTEVEARLWRKHRRTKRPEEHQIRGLIYAILTGSSGANLSYALRNMNESVADV